MSWIELGGRLTHLDTMLNAVSNLTVPSVGAHSTHTVTTWYRYSIKGPQCNINIVL